jgi:hypothetical protein
MKAAVVQGSGGCWLEARIPARFCGTRRILWRGKREGSFVFIQNRCDGSMLDTLAAGMKAHRLWDNIPTLLYKFRHIRSEPGGWVLVSVRLGLAHSSALDPEAGRSSSVPDIDRVGIGWR